MKSFEKKDILYLVLILFAFANVLYELRRLILELRGPKEKAEPKPRVEKVAKKVKLA